MHTSRDDISLIDLGQMEVIGRLIDVFITRTAAQGVVWPFERKAPDIPPERMKWMGESIRQAVEIMGEDPAFFA